MSKSPNISSFTVIVSFLCVALTGLAFFPLLPVKLSPSRTLPQLTVSFNMGGNGARVIEMEVTSKLEAMLARIKGVKKIQSVSGNGTGSVTIDFDKHTNLEMARFEASSIVRQTWPELPQEVSYPTISMSRPDNNDDRPFLSYTLNAAASPAFIHRYAEEQIKPRLASIQGIYRIDVTGATPMEWRLEYDNRQLELLGITVNDIQTAIRQYYQKEFLGTANMNASSGKQEWIRLALIPENGDTRFDAERISLTDKKGKEIKLSQLLRVSRQEQAPLSHYRINGLNSIYFSVRADKTANQLQLAKKIQKTIDELKPILPSGYEIHKSYDATEYIREELNKIYARTAITILILLFFVFLITRNVRYLFLIVVSLIVNLSIALIFYYVLQLEIQLYSLAGITISLSLVIDNVIMMTDHIRNRHNKKAFLSILAATLTTIGALSIIFLLDENIKLNLQDFAAVVIINLAVSLLIALFFVPAMLDKLNLGKKKAESLTRRAFYTRLPLPKTVVSRCYRFRSKRPAVLFTRYYKRQIALMCRWKKSFCVLLILIFGLPVYLIPEQIETEGQTLSFPKKQMTELYNKIFNGSVYKSDIKPITDKVLGGTMRLFVEKVYNGSYFTRNNEVCLNIYASLPNGSTLEQMNNLVGRMESYLSTFSQIKQFQTSVNSPRQATINVFFRKNFQQNGFPYELKGKVISKALELGGGSWSVWGLEDMGFSNSVSESAGSYCIEMNGYNYDELCEWSERVKEKLLSHRRVKEVNINSEFSYNKDDYREFVFDFDQTQMARENMTPAYFFSILNPVFANNINCGRITPEGETEQLKLISRQSREYDIWNMRELPQTAAKKSVKLSNLATINKEQTAQKVVKVNQQYRLFLQYEYIGNNTQGDKMQDKVVNEFKKTLPVGYEIKNSRSFWSWNQKDQKQYLLLLLIIAIIFLITSVLFNSLRQPLAIIFVIPISYIGVFLTFYWFKLNFDQGGFASFVLLCGITVNASIYILNEYNQIRRAKPAMQPVQAYLKAWNAKITPISLTVISTVLGFIPFMIGAEKEAFWFPLAAGTIGGLIMSIAGIFLYLPLFSLSRKNME